MKRILGVLCVAALLSGCGPTLQPVLDQYHVVLAPESLYNCPQVTQWPKIKTLSDLQVAKLLVEQAEDLKICKKSMNALHAFYDNASRKFEMANPSKK